MKHVFVYRLSHLDGMKMKATDLT